MLEKIIKLFDQENNKDFLDEKILSFLIKCDKELVIKEDKKLLIEFKNKYIKYLKNIYDIKDNYKHLDYIIYEYGNDIEIEIYKVLWRLYLKDEYINNYLNDYYFIPEEIREIFKDHELIDYYENMDDQAFISKCKDIIKNRVDIIKQYNVIRFDECISSNINELNKLKPLIFYPGEYEYELHDLIYYILEEYCENDKIWVSKYGLLLIEIY